MQKKRLWLMSLLALLPILALALLRPGGAALPRASAAYTDSSFTAGYNISNSGGYAGTQHPRVVRAADGYLHVTWMEGNDGAYGPAYVWGQESTWPSWVWVGANNNGGYTNPAIALGSDGTIHVVWAGGGSPPYDIYYAYKPAGGSWSTPVNISNSPYFSVYPSIGIDSTGRIWVAFQSSYSDTNNEILVVNKPAGGNWSTPLKLSPSGKDDLNASLVVDKDDVVHIVWRNNDAAPNWEIMYTKYAGGTWTTPVNISATSTASHFPRIATDSSGRLYVIWEDEIDGSDAFDALLRRSTDGGATWSAYVRVSNTTKGLYPAVYADDACNVYAVWQDYRSASTETYFSRSTDCGATWLGDENVSNNGSASYYPDVVAQAGGYAHIVWQDMAPGQLDIYYSKATIALGPTPTIPVTAVPTNTPTATPTNTPTPTPDPRPQGELSILAASPPYNTRYANQLTSTLHLTATSKVGATVTQMWFCNLGQCPTPPLWLPFAEYVANWQLLDDGYPCGFKWVYAAFRDNRGTESVVYPAYIQYDSFLTATMALNGGAAYTNQTMVVVNSEDRDRLEQDCTGLEAVRLKESSALTYTIWMSYTDDIYFFLAPSGPITRTVDAQYRDYAGNAGLFSDSIRFDVNPPYSGTPPTVNSITATKLIITVTGLLAYDDESGVAWVWMANRAGGPWKPFAYQGPSYSYQWNLAYGGPPIQLPGRHHIYVKYEDASGWGPFPGNFSPVYSTTLAVSGIRSAFLPAVLRGYGGTALPPGATPPAAGLLLVSSRPEARVGELVDLYLAVRRDERDPLAGTLRLTLPEGLRVVRAWSAYGTLLQVGEREVVSRERAWSGLTPFIRVQARVERGAVPLLVQGSMEWSGGTLTAAPLRLENR